ncbi:Aldehyde oxidoreductase [Afipia felis]|uniref:Aldehyde oxidoreductase n=3 Tax=Afipia felis TaxID=1035 RepID=A0A380W4L8_AFIFE|nr:xanthine dehydrogenase, molybdopterin binding subunit [Afipia felis ATCC 53690]SUU75847.1 Aldehyde oxidoreductase [Afipia felis]SUU83914.1 Aldehyde oxidoreductase [Afipia felis]
MDQILQKPLRMKDVAWVQVGAGQSHESARLHVSGRANYTDDIPELQGTLHAALGLSPVAAGKIDSIDLAMLKSMPGVVDIVLASDIPGVNDCGPILHDDPILAADQVQYLGQPVFVAIATTRNAARRAAFLARKAITITPSEPVLTARDAHRLGQYVVPPMKLSRGDAESELGRAKHRLDGVISVGGQEQFYLEGQIAYASPADDGGIKVWSSTQHPTEMQLVISHSLGISANKVHVECRRMGGGFGGKESQSALPASVAAICANKLNSPVKLRYDRDDDFMVTGRRHGFEYDYSVGFDDEGRILAAQIDMITNAGFSADLSAPVMTRALCHFDNAYWLPHVLIKGFCAKTNTQSNTAFRGFGGPQGALAMEIIIDKIARHLGRDAIDVRKVNFYGIGRNNVTPYQQAVTDNVIHQLSDDLLESSNYRARRKTTAEFNRTSPILKKGLAFSPVKFGISFNVTHFNQAGALVHVYMDGSVLVNHGGTEMGQGLNTKVAQVVAQELGVDVKNVRCTATDTQKVANTSATAASTGADLNGKAAQDAARQIRNRLLQFAVDHFGCSIEDVMLQNDMVYAGDQELPFGEFVMLAYRARIQLWSDGFYTTPGLHWDPATMSGRPFYYFAYGAAVSEVLIDTLTGEWMLLRADILHDAGKSLNPAIDVGQVEGAFVQGMGWLTNEELVWHPKTGALLTHAPSTYKIPTANDVPTEFHTRLFRNESAVDSIFRSKAVGEPPLLLPFSVWLAICDAISSVGDHKIQPPLRAPATAEAILTAVEQVKKASADIGALPPR